MLSKSIISRRRRRFAVGISTHSTALPPRRHWALPQHALLKKAAPENIQGLSVRGFITYAGGVGNDVALYTVPDYHAFDIQTLKSVHG